MARVVRGQPFSLNLREYKARRVKEQLVYNPKGCTARIVTEQAFSV
jgi:hypothetical protein